ncbi:MAG: sugar phosphate isomerase/epimerase [Desulfuromonadaceae bacterium]
MKPTFAMACLTALNLTPPQAVSVAAKLGYDGIGIRLLPAGPGGIAYPLMDNSSLLKETLACMADTGVKVSDLEMIRVNDTFDAELYRGFLEVGAKLGAKAILVAGDDPDQSRLIANFAALCRISAPYGMTCDLEFMPWTHVPDLASAKQVVGKAACENGGILIDALHFARSNSRLSELDDIPRGWLHYAQLCDAPGEVPAETSALIHTARCERLLPGEGGIDLSALFRRLPADLPVSLEIPNDARSNVIGAEAWARDVLASGRGFFAGLR